MKRLEGKVAIVTGATSGMGRGIATLFAAEGAAVILGGRDLGRGREAEEAIRNTGGQAAFVAGDISQPEAGRILVEEAVSRFGSLDVVVANAGQLGLGSITEVSPETWQRTLATNLDAVFYLLKAAIPVLRKQGEGAIVVNASIAAFRGFPKHAAYCASKGALVSLVRQAAIDYGPAVRINALCPGPVDTPLIWDSAAAFPDPGEVVQQVARKTLMKRLGTPEDVARAALFLASGESEWITGTALTIDGGIMAGG